LIEAAENGMDVAISTRVHHPMADEPYMSVSMNYKAGILTHFKRLFSQPSQRDTYSHEYRLAREAQRYIDTFRFSLVNFGLDLVGQKLVYLAPQENTKSEPERQGFLPKNRLRSLVSALF
ncbi:hypothetical protein KY316_03735, partial [Candidatus Woesearchaeota archaeon]|nr:hypothetical protein [Candidatus Woesearchaeota archaeon]